MSDDHWSKPTKIANAYTDADPALAANGTALVLAFKKIKTNQIYISTGSSGGKWSDPVYTNQTSDHGPALAVYGTTTYLFWVATDGSKKIFYGTVNANSSVTFVGVVANGNAKSKAGPAGVGWNGNMYCSHIGVTSGIGGRQIYLDTYAGSWGADNEVKGQTSKDAPAFSPAVALYLFHRGQTDGIAGNSIYVSQMNPGSTSWSKNTTVPNASSQHRPGASFWTSSFVVLVHNGDIEKHLLWHYLDVANKVWHKMGRCRLVGIKSNYAPALAYLPAEKGDGTTFMVYAEEDDRSDQLNWTTLTGID